MGIWDDFDFGCLGTKTAFLEMKIDEICAAGKHALDALNHNIENRDVVDYSKKRMQELYAELCVLLDEYHKEEK